MSAMCNSLTWTLIAIMQHKEIGREGKQTHYVERTMQGGRL